MRPSMEGRPCGPAGPGGDAEQLAHALGGSVAFLVARQGVYFARREPWPPISPVLRLLRGLYELEPRRARWIARNRIFSTEPRSATCAGATRLAARQMTAAVRATDHGLAGLALLPRIDAGRAAPPPRRATATIEPALAALVDAAAASEDDAGWMALACRMRATMARLAGGTADRRVDKPVVAVLAGADRTLLGWATNTGARNATSHAEVNLVLGWLGAARRPLPRGCRVYTTLKPCKLCAGLVWDSAEDPLQLQVFYGDEDPLRYARETVLDAGSMARRSVARSAAERTHVVQIRLADLSPS